MSIILGLVSFRVFPTHMGGQKGVALFYEHLKQHLSVLLAVSNDNQDTGDPQILPVLHNNKSIYRNMFRLKLLKKIIIKNKVGLLVAEHSYTGWIGWLLHRMTGVPFIIHSHNIEHKRFRQMHQWWWKVYGWYEGWIHRKAQHNFFISEEDMAYAVNSFHVMRSRCSVITYGSKKIQAAADRGLLRDQLGMDRDKQILLFNGTLDYTPNYRAVEILIREIEPVLNDHMKNFQIIITGNRAPKRLIQQIMSARNIVYTGYIQHVDAYYQAADLFLNPVLNDTGVKTKLIEAIANGLTAISTVSGSSGIRKDLCGNKLVTVKDKDWNSFAHQIPGLCNLKRTFTPQSFYDYYSWTTITKKAADKINEIIA